ncbi:uncharacterized protein VTP21DRAFT_7931 [Calcarisporiella thermophila]|uniref:uncharacterized protein n=1 Tax=Calcarisporiella thermophila TaxID=911321 RepID=UPI0037426C51
MDHPKPYGVPRLTSIFMQPMQWKSSAIVQNIASSLHGHLYSLGVELFVVGVVLAFFRTLGNIITDWLNKRFVSRAVFDSRDEAFSYILNWLVEQPAFAKAMQFRVSTSLTRGEPIFEKNLDTTVPQLFFLPAPGTHFTFYRGQPLWLNFHTSDQTHLRHNSNQGPVQIPIETITISVLAVSRDLMLSIVREAQSKFLAKDLDRTVVFGSDQFGHWKRPRNTANRIAKRPMDSVILDPNVKEYVIKDARNFLDSEEWYAERGIPYRRGYLFYGNPGSGKTSFIFALAGVLNLNIYMVNLASRGVTDETINDLVNETPGRCILLMEDVDSAFVRRVGNERQKGLTFSGLLNAIDGIMAQEGRILCMTTNHIERLDPALIRPGRIDVRIHFTNATSTQAGALFRRFYPELPDPLLADTFAEKIPDEKFSMASLQGYLMNFKQNPRVAVEAVEEWVKSGAIVVDDEIAEAEKRWGVEKTRGVISSDNTAEESVREKEEQEGEKKAKEEEPEDRKDRINALFQEGQVPPDVINEIISRIVEGGQDPTVVADVVLTQAGILEELEEEEKSHGKEEQRRQESSRKEVVTKAEVASWISKMGGGERGSAEPKTKKESTLDDDRASNDEVEGGK